MVISNYFVTYKTLVTSNCNRTLTMKMGNALKEASYFYKKWKQPNYLKVTCPPVVTSKGGGGPFQYYYCTVQYKSWKLPL